MTLQELLKGLDTKSIFTIRYKRHQGSEVIEDTCWDELIQRAFRQDNWGYEIFPTVEEFRDCYGEDANYSGVYPVAEISGPWFVEYEIPAQDKFLEWVWEACFHDFSYAIKELENIE